MIKIDFFPFQTTPFWNCILKYKHVHFLVHGHSSWSTFNLHLVRGPKALEIDFLGNQTMEIGQSSES